MWQLRYSYRSLSQVVSLRSSPLLLLKKKSRTLEDHVPQIQISVFEKVSSSGRASPIGVL
jgi:hypothetical protein